MNVFIALKGSHFWFLFLHLYEHILISSLNIALYICQWNFTIYFNLHQHIFLYQTNFAKET